jgi:glucose/arabinose dehydrogenase
MLAAALLLVACGDDDNPIDNGGNGGIGEKYVYELVEAFPNLTFSRPVDIRNAADGSDRLFVVEQTGRILVFANDAAVTSAGVFLDITGQVAYTNQSELGLLGLAFHPQYASNGYFFVYYTYNDGGDRMSRLSRFSVSADANVADAASEAILLEFSQRADNHNGGGLCFDGDGFLCLGLGDEGGSGDIYDNAQNRATPHGSILRLCVDQSVNTPPYHVIPADNPYVGNGNGYREEIYAYGLRNPWRLSYDAPTDVLWCGDVGQAAWEEIDRITSGGNYGWDCREGKHNYGGSSSSLCTGASGFVEPVFEYSHSDGQSITGGYVYRGPTVTSLTGRYVYADFTAGKIWALTKDPPFTAGLLRDTSLFISTFGIAEDGELLVAGYFAAGAATTLYRINQSVVVP